MAQHLPTVTNRFYIPAIVDQVYADLDQCRQMRAGPVILLMSIFIAVTYSWVVDDRMNNLFPTSEEAHGQAIHWMRAVDAVSSALGSSQTASLETVQGLVITSFVAANIDKSQRSRLLLCLSATLARELGLHRIDHPSQATVANTAQAEMGRRLWWSICMLDW